MKTNLVEISKIYQDYLKIDKTKSNEICPEIERIMECVLMVVSKKEKDEILKHSANCASCSQALKEILAISEEIDRFAEKAQTYDEQPRSPSVIEKQTLWSKISGRKAVAVLTAFLGITIITFAVFQFTGRSSKRGVTANIQIILCSPVKTSMMREKGLFKWEGLIRADYYVLELFDKSFNLMWRSGHLRENSAGLTAEVSRQLIPGETYYWMVRAVMEDSTERKSNLAEFSISR